jgi:ATP adenylyltransferase/5',5'''-P-1,P-4-tetraphosphate phosphorylase II
MKEATFDRLLFQEKVLALIDDQLLHWQMARVNYEGLDLVQTRILTFGAFQEIQIQFNPARIRSSTAKVDASSIKERPCFLCREHLPEHQQGIAFGENYVVLVNPYPIFRKHLTIPHVDLVPQRIEGRLKNMLDLAYLLPGFVVFYNGPRCGASAPDHLHFQAVNKGGMPVENEFDNHPGKKLLYLSQEIAVFSVDQYLRKMLVFESSDYESIEDLFLKVYRFLLTCQKSKEDEPMFNILCTWTVNLWQIFIFPRSQHRPHQFFAEEERQILVSPAAVDLGGLFITPREEDFYKIDKSLMMDIMEQITLDDYCWGELKSYILKS